MHLPATDAPTEQSLAQAVRHLGGAKGRFQDRVRATSQLVAGILHEFNTPLGALRSAVDTARAGLARVAQLIDDDPARAKRLVAQLDEVLGVARTATDRIVNSVETLSHFARVDRADVDEADVAQMVETAVRLSGAARAPGARAVVRVAPALRARCRVREVEHVLYHVLRNAREALAGGTDGEIEVVAWRDPAGDVVITVEDNGPGIDSAELPTLFEPTLTTKGRTVGLGLSLATCRYIAQEHGGALDAQNVPGRGARFTFRFRDVTAS